MVREQMSLTAESGQTMAEYAVVLGVIILAVIVSLELLSGGIAAALTTVTDMIKSLK